MRKFDVPDGLATVGAAALRSTRQIAVGALLGLVAACGGGGEDAGTAPPAAAAPAPVAPGTIVGTAAAGAALAGAQVNAVDAAGRTASAVADDGGRFSLSASGLTAPVLLRVDTEDGRTLTSLATSLPADGASQTVNVTPLTHLVVAQIAPAGDPLRWWSSPDSMRAAGVTPERIEQAEQAVSKATAPLVGALGQTQASFVSTPFAADGTGMDQLLDNVDVSVSSVGDNGVFAVRQIANGSTPSVWSGAAEPAPMPVDAARVVSLSVANATIAESYQSYKDAAAQFDPSKVDEARVQSLAQQMTSLDFSAPGAEAQALSLSKQMFAALGMPAALVDKLLTLAYSGSANTVDAMLDLLAAFFGADAAALRAQIQQTKVTVANVDPRSGMVTYRIEYNGNVTYQTWRVNGANPQPGATTSERQHPTCMRSRFVGTQSGIGLPVEYFIRESEFFNECTFEVNYISCIWSAGSVGGGSCSAATSRSAAPHAGTGLREVEAGPLLDQRVFTVCRAPAKPVLVNSSTSDPYISYQARFECRAS
jgi:hypothetical protein